MPFRAQPKKPLALLPTRQHPAMFKEAIFPFSNNWARAEYNSRKAPVIHLSSPYRECPPDARLIVWPRVMARALYLFRRLLL